MSELPTTPTDPDTDSTDAHYGQMALALFEDLAPNDVSIDKAPTEIGYHRADFFLDLDGMSLSARRALDVAYFLVAQTDTGKPNPYYARHTQGEFTTYVVDLEFFKWLMAYTSNNRNHLRSVLRQGQKAAVEVVVHRDSLLNGQSEPVAVAQGATWSPALRNAQIKRSSKITLGKDQSWVSVPLMGTVGIDRNQVYFKVHAQLEPYIKSPLRSHFLDLRLLFKTLRGRILYDRIQPYIQDGITPWFDVNWLKQAMDCTTRVYDEFKYFNARALSKAINDVNTTTHLHLTMQTALDTDGSRRVSQIRFRIEKTQAEGVSPRDEHLTQLQERYRVLVDEFGLNREQMHRIIKRRDEWTDDRIDQAIEYTRFQIQQGKVTRSVAGYFMKAMEEHYVLGTAMKAIIASRAAQFSDPLEKPTPPEIAAYVEQLHKDWEKENCGYYERGYEIAQAASHAELDQKASEFFASAGARAACIAHGLRLADVRDLTLNDRHPLWSEFCEFLARQQEKEKAKQKKTRQT